MWVSKSWGCSKVVCVLKLHVRVNQLLDTICNDEESFKPSRSTPLRKDAAKLQEESLL